MLIAAACGGRHSIDNSAEWVRVLSRKKAAVAPNASPHHKQLYADSLAAFLTRYPAHPRAREVYRRVQLDFARELSALGRCQDAIRFYRAVLTDDPHNRVALLRPASAVDRLTVSRPKLLALDQGLSKRDVAGRLRKPI